MSNRFGCFSAISCVLILALVVSMGILPLTGIYGTPALVEPSSGNNGAETDYPDQLQIGSRTIRMEDIDAAKGAETLSGGGLPKIQSMEQLLKTFKDMGMLSGRMIEKGFEGIAEDGIAAGDRPAVAAAPPADTAPEMDMGAGATEEASGGDYSQTNNQIEGVAEGDIIVSDGIYLYIYQPSLASIAVVRTDGAAMTVESRIPLREGKSDQGLSEMYIRNGFLVTAGTRYEILDSGNPDVPRDTNKDIECCIWYPGRQFTVYTVYDVSDAGNPVQTRVFEVEGNALSTRMIGDLLYFVSVRYLYTLPMEDMGEGDILPIARDTALGEDYKVVPPEEIYYFPGSQDTSYLFVGVMDVTGREPVVMDSYIGGGSIITMNQNSLYVTRYDYNAGGQIIARFAVNGTEISYASEGRVPGYLINQYAMDEYNGYFRAATTDWNTGGNYVTIFDIQTMEQIGQTPAMAPGETIQSVRFAGDTGYVVTFLQTDPLFVLDLSDPGNPTIQGELKIPGFSSYLHPVGDGLLIGFGRNVVETYADIDGRKTVVGTMDLGMKVSLFDVSDPQNPRETDSMALDMNSWSDAVYNPRGIMTDRNRNIFGFDINSWDKNKNQSGFIVLGVENGRLVIKAELDSTDTAYIKRLAYIGGTLYAVTESTVTAYDYTTFVKLGTLKIG